MVRCITLFLHGFKTTAGWSSSIRQNRSVLSNVACRYCRILFGQYVFYSLQYLDFEASPWLLDKGEFKLCNIILPHLIFKQKQACRLHAGPFFQHQSQSSI